MVREESRGFFPLIMRVLEFLSFPLQYFMALYVLGIKKSGQCLYYLLVQCVTPWNWRATFKNLHRNWNLAVRI